MPDRKSLLYTLWLLTSLVLLAWVSMTPNRKSGLVASSSRPDCHRINFPLHQAEPTAHLRAVMDADVVLGGHVPAWEGEEQDRVDALNAPHASCLIPCSFRKVPPLRVVSSRSILSHYPIRC